MTTSNRIARFFFPLLLVLPLTATTGTQAQQSRWSDKDASRIAGEVQKQLLRLTNYSVFDSLHFGLRGGVVTLGGYASRPTLKDDAARVVKKIEGVTEVDNQIEVLPNSPNDDRIRMAVYTNIYRQPALRKYTSNFPNAALTPSIPRAAGGITWDPPLGYHAIHIIVKNGNVILAGVVNSESDSIIAQMQANSTPGVFGVENQLIVPAPQKKKEK
ncbi:MAG: BON domain-containing protein [Acidobacteriaceae bacterium]|nr:BON domain-containing protein [Acidobacteriaceae bacterium]